MAMSKRKKQQRYTHEREYISRMLQDDNIKAVMKTELVEGKEYIYIHNIPFRFLGFRGHAANLRIGNSAQLVFIPRIYFNNDGTFSEFVDTNMTLDWWFYRPDNIHRIWKYLWLIEEAHLEASDYAREKEYEYEQRVGEFYMQDPAEQDAANQVYEEAYNSKIKETVSLTRLNRYTCSIKVTY